MIEITGNMWESRFDSYIRCITTNGFVKRNGCAVLGRGCAKEANDKFNGLAGKLGYKILSGGNKIYFFPEYNLVAFPVKHNWWEKADIGLIVKSALELRDMAFLSADISFLLARPGCGNGNLSWENVKDKIKDILPDNVFVISFD